MAEKRTGEDLDSQGPWRFIPLERYERPKAPVVEAVRQGRLGRWGRFVRHPSLAAKAFKGAFTSRSGGNRQTPGSLENLMARGLFEKVPRKILDQAVQTPDPAEGVPALEAALEGWLKGGAEKYSMQLVIDAPYSGVATTVAKWALNHEWRILEPPLTEELLDLGTFHLPRSDHDPNAPLAIPQLERYYLRHCDGLTLIRELLDWLISGSRVCLIGCSSWAWAFLDKALQLRSLFPNPITADAFDHNRLQVWLRSLAHGDTGPRFVFRQADSGELVLPPAAMAVRSNEEDRNSDTETDRVENHEPVTNFLEYAAARSRGIPGVALAIWRHSLRSIPEEETRQKVLEKVDGEDGMNLWVKPWSKMDLPSMPIVADNKQVFVLHAVLLHNGLSTSVLQQILPISSMALLETLHHLRDQQLLENEGGLWRVTPLGYPAVRDYLENEGYLVDMI